MTIQWTDLPDRIERALVKKVAGFHTKSGERREVFGGLTEQDVVLATARLLEASGFDVYLEHRYENGRDRCDLVAYDWSGGVVWIEVKLLFDGNDNRLNTRRFNADGGEVRKDFNHLVTVDSSATRIVLLGCLSRSEEIVRAPGEAMTMRWGDVLDALQPSFGEPSKTVAGLAEHAETAAHAAFLHLASWEIANNPRSAAQV